MPKIIASEPKKNIGKRVLIALIVVVVLAGIGAGGWYWWQHNQKSSTPPAQPTGASTKGNVDTSKVSQVQKKAMAAANTASGGSVDDAAKVYDQAIQSTPPSDTSTVASLYYGKAQLLYNDGQFADAVTAAQKAVDLDPSAFNYGVLGAAYAGLNQNDKAIAAYKSALNALNSLPDNGGAGRSATGSFYEDEIKRLGGTV